MYAQEISVSIFVELCLGVVVSEISLYFTRTLYGLLSSLTNLCNRQSQFTHDIVAALLSLTKTDQSLSSAVPVYLLVSSIPYTCHEVESKVCT